ncbi:hypothetical protein N752_05415 [Desulforamulus aquiferis]|nr:hypothetical protein N752_05415 [Desulforamulus aquiferis]
MLVGLGVKVKTSSPVTAVEGILPVVKVKSSYCSSSMTAGE